MKDIVDGSERLRFGEDAKDVIDWEKSNLKILRAGGIQQTLVNTIHQ